MAISSDGISGGISLDGISTAGISTPRGGGGFNPGDYGDAYIWLDAQDSGTITLTGDLVESWKDKVSGIEFAKTGGSDGARPTLDAVINGLNAMDFNGTANSLTADNTAADYTFLTNTANTGFIVYHIDAYNTSSRLMGSKNGGNTTGFDLLAFLDTPGLNLAVTYQVGGTNLVQMFNTGDIPAADQAVVVGWRYDPTLGSGQKLSIWYAGTQNNATDPGTTSSTPFGPLAIGSSAGATAGTFLNGQIGEVMIWSSALSDDSMGELDTILKSKWGI